MDTGIAPLILSVILGYLFGSIPFGLLLTHAVGLGDLRSIGSGNIGATNVLRTGRKGLALATLLLDGLKGTAAVLAAQWIWPDSVAPLLAGFGALCGHCFPVWLGFRGGKGVATYVGVLAAIAWPIALLFGGVWIAAAIVTRFSSLSALVATAITPFALWGLGYGAAAMLFAVLSAIAWARHHQNISRLLAGTESRIGAKG